MESISQDNNKRIAKNTLLLYVRLLLTMVIGLYTSRVVLNTLGIGDYGIYNVVAGFVSMFSLFTGSISAAISRFLTYSLGKGDTYKLGKIFSSSLIVMIGMAIVIVIVAEMFGVWFLNSQLNIPTERMGAANWVFHMAVLSFGINLISIPYNASIISHEKMDFFAYISILEVILKLVIVLMLTLSPWDKLIIYSILYTGVALIIRLVYGIYCKRNFVECREIYIPDKSLLKEMFGFAGWNFFGSGAYLFNTQGINIISNIYFGVTINAARGIANQVEGVVRQFVTNFTTAINPQIIKSYASNNLSYMHSLICRGAKFSYLLMLFFVVPFMFETETIMHVWLKTYPPEAPLFLRLTLIGTLFDMLGNSSANAAWATGSIKKYYIIIGSVGCLVFPLSWFCFYLGAPAYTSYAIFIILYIILMLLKIYIIKPLVSFAPQRFFKEVLAKIVPTTIVSFIIPVIVYYSMHNGLLRTAFVIILSELSVVFSILYIGLTTSERNKIMDSIVKKMARLKR